MRQIKITAQHPPILVNNGSVRIAEVLLRRTENDVEVVLESPSFLLDQIVRPEFLHVLTAPAHIYPVHVIGEKVVVVQSVGMERDAPLAHVAGAKSSNRRRLGPGQCRQKKCGQDRNDGDDHQQFDQSEAAAGLRFHNLGKCSAIRNPGEAAMQHFLVGTGDRANFRAVLPASGMLQ